MIANDKQRYKKIDYTYDLISGNVNEVKYQAGQTDQFLHRYYYDADNRITSVETSTDGVSWSRDAKYFYYKHGPLKRTELGEYKVQGTDYVYTLQGWIKGVNSNTLMAQRDPGKDGDATANGVNRYVAGDAFSYSLGYYNSDYKPIQPKAPADYFLAATAGFTGLNALAPDLYNGNISQMVTSIKGVLTDIGIPKPQLTLYQYDQLNRIKEMKAYSKINMETNAWGSGTDMDGAHKTSMEYDANGNITKMKRNGKSDNLAMDDMEYLYENVLSGSVKNTNKLIQVLDKANSSTYSTDIDGQEAKNYTYDEIGNLKKDNAEKISNIEWSVYGKPLKITKNIGGYGLTTEIEFRYDAIGNRIAKIVKPMYNIDNPEAWNHTFYVRDASGNVMATYQRTGYTKLMLEEQSIYGSSRLGVQRRNLDFMAATTNPSYKYYLNQKYYELSDHRGNVNTTISDFRIGVGSVANPRVLSHYTAVIRSTADYGVWGDELVGRGERSKDFRYGYNGKEKDQDGIGGGGSTYDYGFRIYNPQLGKFLSVDPIGVDYPFYSPYHFAGNRPIDAVDIDGLEPGSVVRKWSHSENYGGPFEPGDIGERQDYFNTINIVKASNLPVVKLLNDRSLIGGTLTASFNPKGELISANWTGFKEKSFEQKFYSSKGVGTFKAGGLGTSAKASFNKYSVGVRLELYGEDEHTAGINMEFDFSVSGNAKYGAKGLESNIFDFKPSVEANAYAFLKQKEMKSGINTTNSTYGEGSATLGIGAVGLKLEGNTAGTYRAGISTGKTSLKVGITNKTTLSLTSGTIRISE